MVVAWKDRYRPPRPADMTTDEAISAYLAAKAEHKLRALHICRNARLIPARIVGGIDGMLGWRLAGGWSHRKVERAGGLRAAQWVSCGQTYIGPRTVPSSP